MSEKLTADLLKKLAAGEEISVNVMAGRYSYSSFTHATCRLTKFSQAMHPVVLRLERHFEAAGFTEDGQVFRIEWSDFEPEPPPPPEPPKQIGDGIRETIVPPPPIEDIPF